MRRSLSGDSTGHMSPLVPLADGRPPHAAARRRVVPRDRRVMTCNEAERLYRLRHGRVADDYRARLIRGKRRGRAILVSAKQCEELYGV